MVQHVCSPQHLEHLKPDNLPMGNSIVKHVCVYLNVLSIIAAASLHPDTNHAVHGKGYEAVRAAMQNADSDGVGCPDVHDEQGVICIVVGLRHGGFLHMQRQTFQLQTRAMTLHSVKAQIRWHV